MKIFGKDVNVFKNKVFAEGKKKSSMSSKEIGATGTPIFSGIISGEEYLPELQYRNALVVYDKMRRSDATVGAALLVCKLPLLGAKWFVEPADPNDPESKMQADFIEKCLMEKSETGFQDFLRQSLLMLDFGYMVFEKVFQIVEYEYNDEGNPENGLPALKVPKKEYIGWKKFASRLPKSIYRWEMTPDPISKKPRPGITQILPQGGTPEIPMEKLLLFINNKEGDNYNGISILRQAYKHWYFKDAYYKIDAIGFERQAVGIPTMSLPAGFDDDDKAKAEELCKQIRANEKQYLVKPDTWTFEFADMKAHTLKDPSSAIEHHDSLILKSVLAQFLNLGSTSNGSGSRAVSSDHSDIFFEALQATARQICDVINKHAIPQLIDLNFDTDKYPKLSFAKIGKVNWSEYGTALSALTSAGLLTPDKVTEEYIREQLELPDMQNVEPQDYENNGSDADDNAGGQMTPGAKAKVKVDTGKIEKDDPKEDKNEAPTKKPMDSQGKKNASEVKKKRMRMSEPYKLFEPWRALTFAEKKVNFQLIQDRITEYEDKFKSEAKDVLSQAISPLLAEFKQHIQDKNSEGIKNISLPYKNNYALVVIKFLKLPYEFGKKTASSEMKIQAPQTPQSELDRIKIQADMIADLHESDIIKAMKLKAIDSLKKIKASEAMAFAVKKKKEEIEDSMPLPVETVSVGATVASGDLFEEAMAQMEDEMSDIIDTITENTANLTTGMLYNQGRTLAQEFNSENIYALQRSEVLDSNVCDFCMSMDGLIVEKDDPQAQEEEYHSNCRGMWVEIMKDESELPEITGVPEELADKYNGINDIKKMDKPILREDSIAYDYYHKGK